MRDVAFVRSPGIGPEHEQNEETLPLDRFLLQIPALLVLTVPRAPIPPLSILNEVLRQGFQSSGMSGSVRWTPFEITAREYVAAIVALRLRGSYSLEPPPSWVRSLRDWKAWVLESNLNTRPEIARAVLEGTSDDDVRTPVDDKLMSLAKELSDAELSLDGSAIQCANETLESFIATWGQEAEPGDSGTPRR